MSGQGQLALVEACDEWSGDGAWRHVLPGGSVAVVEPIGNDASLVSREVAGAVVWGQAFSCSLYGNPHAHRDQVRRVIAAMAADPTSFARWWHPEDGFR